jgi:hypothetical protein
MAKDHYCEIAQERAGMAAWRPPLRRRCLPLAPTMSAPAPCAGDARVCPPYAGVIRAARPKWLNVYTAAFWEYLNHGLKRTQTTI